MADLIITAPIKGWAEPLEAVPDPVFADRMMGDGIAIQPTGSTVHAPCDGVVVALHAAGHAVTLRNDAGAEILIHTGLDTVALGGKGFRAHTAEGARVSRGDPLIEFDMDAVALAATSLITPVIVTNSDSFRIARRTTGQLVGVGEALMTLEPVAQDERDWAGEGGETVRRAIVLPLVHGIHARPAARIADCARGFEAEVSFVRNDRRASARSAVALMTMALRHKDEVAIEASGRDAAAAVEALAALIAGGLGESKAPAASPPAPAYRAPTDVPEDAIPGIPAASGFAIGTAVWMTSEVPEVARDADDPAQERLSLSAALAVVREHLESGAGGSETERDILAAHLAFLDDESLRVDADAHIAAGRSAGFGWSEAIATQVSALQQSGDARFAERIGDLEDLKRQVLLALAGRDREARRFAPGTILLADDLLPSQLMGIDRTTLSGIALARGGATSHVAILAASTGLPMVVGAGPDLAKVPDGTALVLDAEGGLIHVGPEPGEMASHRVRLDQLEARRARAMAAAHAPCRTVDGSQIELFANLASVEDAAAAVTRGAEGCGLLRTEFLFMGRDSAPDEAEQHASYQAIADAMQGRPVIVRLLDIGGDKPAPWLKLAAEKNPMLGLRGIRVTLAEPALLETQLRAILRVRPEGQCRIMVPMVTGLNELRAVRAAIERIGGGPASLGVMIETPAAAITADLIAAEADFLSIGTNDLSQYALATDRENPAVTAGSDAMHPAVLRLIASSCEGGAKHDRPVGVCGGLASDPLAIPLLIGLGVTELSTTPGFLPEAKALVRALDLPHCRALAARALELASADEVRALARTHLEELG